MKARETPNAAEGIAARLRSEIIDDLADGDLIGSAEALAARFGVSGPTIRQTMRVLEAEGLVRVRPGNRGGFFASTPSIDVVSRSASALLRRRGAGLADFLVLYQLIGPEMAAQIAASPDIAARQRLPDYVEQQWARATEMTVTTALDVWANFGHEVVHLCESQSLALVAAVLGDLLLELRPKLETLPPDISRSFVNHLRDGQRRLARAISDGDVAQARFEMMPTTVLPGALHAILAGRAPDDPHQPPGDRPAAPACRTPVG
jgi:GntR family transcriptional regulator, transcriptional repressor for pyruvate dehydrogenase complex